MQTQQKNEAVLNSAKALKIHLPTSSWNICVTTIPIRLPSLNKLIQNKISLYLQIES